MVFGSCYCVLFFIDQVVESKTAPTEFRVMTGVLIDVCVFFFCFDVDGDGCFVYFERVWKWIIQSCAVNPILY